MPLSPVEFFWKTNYRLESRRRLANIHEGAEVTGTVKNLTDYGAFVDLGGIDGLLHVTDLSYGNVTHPAAVVQVGEQVTVKVLKFDKEKERISLGLKQMHPDPWVNIEARYPRAQPRDWPGGQRD